MLEEARELLQAAEAETDPAQKLASLEEALDLLDDVEDAKDRAIAGNLRRSYTRRLISQLFALRKADILTWFDYVRVLVFRLEAEVAEALEESPDLKARYDEFLGLWAVDAVEALRPGNRSR